MDFWSIAIRPGRPLAFGEIDGKLIFGLPGNPVSSLLGFELFVRPALRAGAHGYLVKGSGVDDLGRAIRAVAAGERFLDAKAAAIDELDDLDLQASGDDLQRLTAREREVLQLVAEGHTNREVAELLGLSPKTVDVHRTNTMRKLDLHSAQALTRYALRRGIISSE